MMKRMIAVALGVGALALSIPAPSFAQGGPGAWGGSDWATASGCRFISPYQGWGCPAYRWGSAYGGNVSPSPFPYADPRCRFLSPNLGWGCYSP